MTSTSPRSVHEYVRSSATATSLSSLSHPRASYRLAQEFSAAASPTPPPSPSLEHIRARLQDVMRSIDNTLGEANTTATAQLHTTHALPAPAVPAAPSATSSRCSSNGSSASWPLRRRVESAAAAAAAVSGLTMRAQQDERRAEERPPFSARVRGHDLSASKHDSAFKTRATAGTGSSATYQTRVDFWHPGGHHALPRSGLGAATTAAAEAATANVGTIRPPVSAALAPSVTSSALSSQKIASKYARPISRAVAPFPTGGAGGACSRLSNTYTDTLNSTSVTTGCSSSRASSTSEEDAAGVGRPGGRHTAPRMTAHTTDAPMPSTAPPRVPLLDDRIPTTATAAVLTSLPHPSTVPSLSARLAVLRAADAVQRTTLQHRCSVLAGAEDRTDTFEVNADRGFSLRRQEMHSSGWDQKQQQQPQQQRHTDPVAGCPGRTPRPPGAAATPTRPSPSQDSISTPLHLSHLAGSAAAAAAPPRSPRRPPPARPTTNEKPVFHAHHLATSVHDTTKASLHVVEDRVNASHHSDVLVCCPGTARASSPGPAERRTRRSARQAETAQLVALAMERQAAAETAWREDHTPLALQRQHRRLPLTSHPLGASTSATAAPLDALQARLTPYNALDAPTACAIVVSGDNDDRVGGGVVELPMKEELAARARIAARRRGEGISLPEREQQQQWRSIESRPPERYAQVREMDSAGMLQQRQEKINARLAAAAAAASAAATVRSNTDLPSRPSGTPDSGDLRSVHANAEQLARPRERLSGSAANPFPLVPAPRHPTNPKEVSGGKVVESGAAAAGPLLTSSLVSSSLNIPEVTQSSAVPSRLVTTPVRRPPPSSMSAVTKQNTANTTTLPTAVVLTTAGAGVRVEDDVVSSCEEGEDTPTLSSSVSATSVEERADTPEKFATAHAQQREHRTALLAGGGGGSRQPQSTQHHRQYSPQTVRRAEEGSDTAGVWSARDGAAATQLPSSMPPSPPLLQPPAMLHTQDTHAHQEDATRMAGVESPVRTAASTQTKDQRTFPSSALRHEPPSPLPVKPSRSAKPPSLPQHDGGPSTGKEGRLSLPVEDAERDIVSSCSPPAARPSGTPADTRCGVNGGDGGVGSLAPERLAGLQGVRLHVSPVRGPAWQSQYAAAPFPRSSPSSSCFTSDSSPSATPLRQQRSPTHSAPTQSPTQGPTLLTAAAVAPLVARTSSRSSVAPPTAADPLRQKQHAIRAEANQRSALRARAMLIEHGLSVDVQLAGRRLPAVVKLSKDAAELLFYLERVVRPPPPPPPAEATSVTESPVRTPPRARRVISPAPSAATSEVSGLVAHARSVSPAVATLLPSHVAADPRMALQQHAACQRGSLYSVAPSVRLHAPPTAPAAAAVSPQQKARAAAPPQPVQFVKMMLGGGRGGFTGPTPAATQLQQQQQQQQQQQGQSPARFHTLHPPQKPAPALIGASVAPQTPSPAQRHFSPPLLPHQPASVPAATHVRELHHFPCSHARVYAPYGVMGYEEDFGLGGPHTWEDVGGVLCGPASYEVLRRYGCPLFARMRGSDYAPYRVYVIIPEFRRIDVPQDAVLLVLDFHQRVDWALFVLALQRNVLSGESVLTPATSVGDLSWEGGVTTAAAASRVLRAPLLSYGRVLWVLAVQRLQRARALRGLNPFEWNAASSKCRQRSALAAVGAGRFSPPRRGRLVQLGGDGDDKNHNRSEDDQRDDRMAQRDARVARLEPPQPSHHTGLHPSQLEGRPSARAAAAAAASLRSPRRGWMGAKEATHPSAVLRAHPSNPSPSSRGGVQLDHQRSSADRTSGAESRMRQPEKKTATSGHGTAPPAARPLSEGSSSVECGGARPLYAEETSLPRHHWLRRVASSLRSSRRSSLSSRRRASSKTR